MKTGLEQIKDAYAQEESYGAGETLGYAFQKWKEGVFNDITPPEEVKLLARIGALAATVIDGMQDSYGMSLSDQFTQDPEYKAFIAAHPGKIPPMTETEAELLAFLIKKKIGGFEKIVKLYRELVG